MKKKPIKINELSKLGGVISFKPVDEKALDSPSLIERCIGYVDDQTNALLKIKMLQETENKDWTKLKDLAEGYPQENLDL